MATANEAAIQQWAAMPRRDIEAYRALIDYAIETERGRSRHRRVRALAELSRRGG